METRNIAIIAHVDHGKTTLVDTFLKVGGGIKEHQELAERAMDSNDQEKERGITIYAKNTAINYKDTKINIVDTPGHADFGSEVERVLGMVDAALLVVDAAEGPMPQTRFVVGKAIAMGLPIFVVINKIDKPMARPSEVVDEVFDLLVQLGASDEQLDFTYNYAIAKDGIGIQKLDDEQKDMTPILDTILDIVPVAKADTEAEFVMQPATLQYDNFLGRLALGRVFSGKVKAGQTVNILTPEGEKRTGKISKVFSFLGMQKVEVEYGQAGDIIAVAGLDDIYVGETITSNPEMAPLPAIKVDPPALSMTFMVNDSPFAGREGSLVTSRQIRDRLEKELETNVGLQIEFPDNADEFKVMGRGEMHVAVLAESMRREGFELQISQPEVLMKEENGQKMEPVEHVMVSVPDDLSGTIIQLLSERKGEMLNMVSKEGYTNLEFKVPTRGLLGTRSAFIIMTKGEGTLASSFDSYEPYKGEIRKRAVGSLISGETGTAMGYSLWNLQERGPLFINPGTEVYEGMIIGEHNQGSDLTVNPLKNKKLTNVRSSGADDAINLTPPRTITLEGAIEYIKEDEYVEVTPESIRLRKKFLTEVERKRNKNK